MQLRRKCYQLAIAIACAGFVSIAVCGQAAPGKPLSNSVRSVGGEDLSEELSVFLDKAAAADEFSGAVIVARDAQPLFSKAYGMANKSTGSPNNVDTKFNLGSLNKMFTAVAIAQLAEGGKLSFSDTVGKLLPDYPNKAVAEKVTVHQLLTHSSGMGNYQNETYSANLAKIKTVRDLLPLFASDPLAFEPGSKWQYSNAGYAVLGLVVEQVSGQNYFDYVKEHIFKPAGMVNTDSYERGKEVPNLAVGYTRMNDDGRSDPSIPRRENTLTRPAKGSPAGGGYSTVADLLRFSVALRGHKLLSKKYTEIVMSGKVEVGGPIGKYAYGFGDKVFNGKHIIGHNGGSPGIGANFDIFPELGYTAVVLTNYDPPAMFPVFMKMRELIPTTSPSASEQPEKQSSQPVSTNAQEVLKLERAWLDAYERRDETAMNSIVADDFSITFPDGSMLTKPEVIASLKRPAGSSTPSVKIYTEGVQARVYGDTVILTGRVVVEYQRDGKTIGKEQQRYTDTYVKRQGSWQVVASHLSNDSPPPKRN